MVLDENLFSYNAIRHADKPHTWSVMHSHENYYEKSRSKVPAAYASQLIDALSGSILAEAQSKPLNSSKLITLMLHNPDTLIELKNTAKIGFEWCFEYEGETYRWSRDNAFQKDLSCKMLRKPDPSIAIALYSNRDKTTHSLSILDYNVERTNVKDRKGLEYILLMCMFVFIDKEEDASKNNTEFKLGEESKGDTLKQELAQQVETESKKNNNSANNANVGKSSGGILKMFHKKEDAPAKLKKNGKDKLPPTPQAPQQPPRPGPGQGQGPQPQFQNYPQQGPPQQFMPSQQRPSQFQPNQPYPQQYGPPHNQFGPRPLGPPPGQMQRPQQPPAQFQQYRPPSDKAKGKMRA